MAEALANRHCSDFAEACSAGLEPGSLNPLAVEVLREVGIDISGHPTRAVLDLFKTGHKYDRVITVCDQEASERCPLFPGRTERLHWSFDDPSKFEGTWEEKLEQTRKVRDAIQAAIRAWCESECAVCR